MSGSKAQEPLDDGQPFSVRDGDALLLLLAYSEEVSDEGDQSIGCYVNRYAGGVQ